MSERLFLFLENDPPEQQMLAVALSLCRSDLSQGLWRLSIPSSVFEALAPEVFKRLFSDLIIEAFPDIEDRLEVTVSKSGGFEFGSRVVDQPTSSP
ncbi:MAG: hypothetical protein EBS90_12860 [Betaproteobacteria bacterium]|nr:hypothetical protein [Betaproteobacteria bacterium]